jgi:hypothetical protein
MSPITVSLSDSKPLYVSHYCVSVGFKHSCMSPVTLSLSFSLSRVPTPLYVSHYCLSVGFQHHCMSPRLVRCNSLIAALIRLKSLRFSRKERSPANSTNFSEQLAAFIRLLNEKYSLSKLGPPGGRTSTEI